MWRHFFTCAEQKGSGLTLKLNDSGHMAVYLDCAKLLPNKHKQFLFMLVYVVNCGVSACQCSGWILVTHLQVSQVPSFAPSCFQHFTDSLRSQWVNWGLCYLYRPLSWSRLSSWFGPVKSFYCSSNGLNAAAACLINTPCWFEMYKRTLLLPTSSELCCSAQSPCIHCVLISLHTNGSVWTAFPCTSHQRAEIAFCLHKFVYMHTGEQASFWIRDCIRLMLFFISPRAFSISYVITSSKRAAYPI